MANTQELKQVLAKKQAILQGDAKRIAKQRADGKLTARERIAKLLDQGSFVEMDALVSKNDDYAGVITGYGTIQDRPVYLFAQDFTVHGGAMGEQHAKKVCKVLDLALKTGAPVVALCDSAGVRLDEGARAMNAYSEIYARMAKLSGVCPMIAVVLGPAIGGAALLTQLADVSIQAENVGRMMVYGPQVISALTGKTVDDKMLGGAGAMAAQGGISLTAETEEQALALTAAVLDFLPGSNLEDAPENDSDDLNRLISDAKDSDSLMMNLADNGKLIELYKDWGKEIRVAFTRIGGFSVGLVVSNSAVNDGELTPAACAKAARFIRFCDCYSLPLISLIDSKGVQVPDIKSQSWTMITTAELLYAYAEATTAKISVVVGNAIGQSYIAMAGKAHADIAYAWPGAVISALTPAAAVQVLCAEELRKAKKAPLEARAELEERFAADVADGIAAARDGMVDDVIEPAETRKHIIAALEMLASKRDSNPPKKHGNLPL